MNNKILLCVNIDHVATLRQARGGQEPSVIEIAKLCEQAGADGITLHLREDRRHIQDQDLLEIKQNIKQCSLTMEMAATEEMLEIAKKVKPNLITLVPEKRLELTTEGGLNIKNNTNYYKNFIQEAKKNNLNISLFIEPEPEIIDIACELNTDYIELHTGKYSNLYNTINKILELNKLKEAAMHAHSLGLSVNAGHGLNVQNLPEILEIPNIKELHIGHSIIARALFVGIKQAIEEIKCIIKAKQS